MRVCAWDGEGGRGGEGTERVKGEKRKVAPCVSRGVTTAFWRFVFIALVCPPI